MVVLSSSAERLREELEKKGLTKFDDETLQHLASSLEGQFDNEEVVEAWSPFIVDSSDLEENSARNVCLEILRRLNSSDSSSSSTSTGGASERGDAIANRSAPSTTPKSAALADVPGLREWLKNLKLAAYYDTALAWCHDQGAADVSEVKENWQEFRDSLVLKPLERKRMCKDMGESSPTVTPDRAGGHQTKDGSPRGEKEEVKKKELVVTQHQFGGNKENDIPYTYDPVHDKLGSGATADVFRCRRLEEGQLKEYAVKSISLQKLKLRPNFGEIQERMRREVQILFKLRHENVVSLYDVVTEDSKLHLVMDLVEGGDLFARIPEQFGMQELKARYVFLQLVPALQYIHKQNVVHRDLKPENILVDEKASFEGNLKVKITDFGHSKSIDDDSLACTKVGTSQYWAPEVATSNGQSKYDATVDLWSLGVTLYLMLEGIFPFQGDAHHQKAIFSFKEDTDERHSCSAEAQNLIQKLITVSPKDRISLEECMGDAWTKGRELLNRKAETMNKNSICQEVAEKAERFIVPFESCWSHKQLRTDLAQFSQVNSCSAEARRQGEHREVVVTWSRTVTEHQLQESRGSLWELLDHHFPSRWKEAGGEEKDDSKATRRGKGGKAEQAKGGKGKERNKERASPPADWGQGMSNAYPVNQLQLPSPAFRELSESSSKPLPQGSFRLLKSTLRVDEKYGAGVDLLPEEGRGMLVEAVSEFPGQQSLQKGDIIHKIAQVSLAYKCVEDISTIFSQHFKDGVEIQIKRTKGGGR